MRDKISIIIPVHNSPSLLKEALDSVYSQTVGLFEAIIIDDGSENDVQPIVEGYDDRSEVLTHEENQGAAAARNTGIEHAEGKYIAFLDADDTWKPTKLEKQRDVFESGDEDLGLVYTGLVQYELDGSEWERHPESRGDIYLEEMERDRVHPTSTVMIRQEVVEEVGGFDTSLSSRQDYDLWLRITKHYTVDYVDEVLVDKREQPDSISKDFESRIEGDIAVFEKVRHRASDLDFSTRSRIYSYHHHVIGRDYESNGDRWKAVKHLVIAILRYPIRPISWVMFVIAVLGIDRNGPLLNFAKELVR